VAHHLLECSVDLCTLRNITAEPDTDTSGGGADLGGGLLCIGAVKVENKGLGTFFSV